MLSISYLHEGKTINSTVTPFKDGMYDRYLVHLPDGPETIIAPMGFPGPGGMKIWVQANRKDEPIYDQEVIQTIGVAIEKALANY